MRNEHCLNSDRDIFHNITAIEILAESFDKKPAELNVAALRDVSYQLHHTDWNTIDESVVSTVTRLQALIVLIEQGLVNLYNLPRAESAFLPAAAEMLTKMSVSLPKFAKDHQGRINLALIKALPAIDTAPSPVRAVSIFPAPAAQEVRPLLNVDPRFGG